MYHIGQIFKQTDVRLVNKFCVNNAI